MSKVVHLNTPAPDFVLKSYQGDEIRLSDFAGRKHLILVFNRGFT